MDIFRTIPKNNSYDVDWGRLGNTLESMNDLVSMESLYDMDTNMVPVSEGYIGKTKNLIEIEHKIDQMIKNYGPRSSVEKSYHSRHRQSESSFLINPQNIHLNQNAPDRPMPTLCTQFHRSDSPAIHE